MNSPRMHLLVRFKNDPPDGSWTEFVDVGYLVLQANHPSACLANDQTHRHLPRTAGEGAMLILNPDHLAAAIVRQAPGEGA